MQWLYLAGLLLSIAGMATLDWRYRLAFWHDRTRTLLTITVGVLVFVLWDLIAIKQGIFIHGDSRFMLSFTLAPEFPVEEIFFLILLCYCTLVIYRAGERIWPRT